MRQAFKPQNQILVSKSRKMPGRKNDFLKNKFFNSPLLQFENKENFLPNLLTFKDLEHFKMVEEEYSGTRAAYAVKESALVFFPFDSLQSQLYEFIEIAHIDHTMV